MGLPTDILHRPMQLELVLIGTMTLPSQAHPPYLSSLELLPVLQDHWPAHVGTVPSGVALVVPRHHYLTLSLLLITCPSSGISAVWRIVDTTKNVLLDAADVRFLSSKHHATCF
jgi:hypothetical protein